MTMSEHFKAAPLAGGGFNIYEDGCLQYTLRREALDAIKAAEATEAEPGKVYIVNGEHQAIPGMLTSAHSTRELADKRAWELLKVQAEYAPGFSLHSPDADGVSWEGELVRLREFIDSDTLPDIWIIEATLEQEAAKQEPETLVQFCERLMNENDNYLADDGPALDIEEWQRARKLMLGAVELVALLATMTDPHYADDLDGELNAFARLIEKAQELTGTEPDNDTDARARLLKERNTLMNSFGHGPAADGATRDRIAAIDSELMLSECDIETLNNGGTID
jgi:hypothetical protein